VKITPVTYGGTLGKGKLEQMYGIYAAQGFMKMEEGIDDRVDLLRNVFSIPEKKAEGIIMKSTQKAMMKMLQSPEGMEEMQQMMGGMGLEGMGDMAGMMGGEEGPNLEQLKETLTQLKTMKDSGAIPPEELATVRRQFKDAFGSSIDDIAKQAEEDPDAMSDADSELLQLVKEILE
jgi:hypothetical protein